MEAVYWCRGYGGVRGTYACTLSYVSAARAMFYCSLSFTVFIAISANGVYDRLVVWAGLFCGGAVLAGACIVSGTRKICLDDSICGAWAAFCLSALLWCNRLVVVALEGRYARMAGVAVVRLCVVMVRRRICSRGVVYGLSVELYRL